MFRDHKYRRVVPGDRGSDNLCRFPLFQVVNHELSVGLRDGELFGVNRNIIREGDFMGSKGNKANVIFRGRKEFRELRENFAELCAILRWHRRGSFLDLLLYERRQRSRSRRLRRGFSDKFCRL